MILADRHLTVALRVLLTCCLLFVALFSSSCGGGNGGIPSGLAAGVLDVRVAVNVLALQSGTATSTSQGILYDITGNARSFKVRLKGAAPSGGDINKSYNVNDSSLSHQLYQFKGSLYTDAGHQNTELATMATPIYLLKDSTGQFYRITEFYKPSGKQVFLSKKTSKTDEDYNIVDSSVTATNVVAVTGADSYGSSTDQTIIRAGQLDAIIYFYDCTALQQDTPGSNNSPVLALVFQTTVATNQTVVNLTDPTNGFKSLSGTVRNVTISVPSTGIDPSQISDIRFTVQDTTTADNLGQTVLADVVPSSGTGGNYNFTIPLLDHGQSFALYGEAFYSPAPKTSELLGTIDGSQSNTFTLPPLTSVSSSGANISLSQVAFKSSITGAVKGVLTLSAGLNSPPGAFSITAVSTGLSINGSPQIPITIANGAVGLSFQEPASTLKTDQGLTLDSLITKTSTSALDGTFAPTSVQISDNQTYTTPGSSGTGWFATFTGVGTTMQVDLNLQIFQAGSAATLNFFVEGLPPNAGSFAVQAVELPTTGTGASFQGQAVSIPTSGWTTSDPNNNSVFGGATSIVVTNRGFTFQPTVYVYSEPAGGGHVVAILQGSPVSASTANTDTISLAKVDSTIKSLAVQYAGQTLSTTSPYTTIAAGTTFPVSVLASFTDNSTATLTNTLFAPFTSTNNAAFSPATNNIAGDYTTVSGISQAVIGAVNFNYYLPGSTPSDLIAMNVNNYVINVSPDLGTSGIGVNIKHSTKGDR